MAEEPVAAPGDWRETQLGTGLHYWLTETPEGFDYPLDVGCLDLVGGGLHVDCVEDQMPDSFHKYLDG